MDKELMCNSGNSVIRLSGVINKEKGDILEDELLLLFKQGDKEFTLDMERVEFVTVGGLKSFLHIFEKAIQLGFKINLLNLPPHLKKVALIFGIRIDVALMSELNHLI